MADKMRQEEIIATAPPEPNASPTDAEYAYGFLGGTAQRPFFNKVMNRLSEVLFDVQNKADQGGVELLEAVGDADASLIYSEDFNGTLGNDVRLKTPNKGNNLTNDSGETNKYYFGPNSSAVRTDADLTPVYTDCGQDSDDLIYRLGFTTNINRLSKVGDRVGLSLNCTGKYQRTDIYLEVFNNPNLAQIQLKIATYDNFGAETVEYFLSPQFNSDDFNQRTLTMVVKQHPITFLMEVQIPELGFSVDTGEAMVQAANPGTNDHGFILTPTTFSVNSLKIHDRFIFTS